LLFWLLLQWSHRLDQASYLGEVYRESVEDFEYKRLAALPTEKWREGTYHREVEVDGEWISKNPRPAPPEGIQAAPVGFSPGAYPWYGTSTGTGTPLPPPPAPAAGPPPNDGAHAPDSAATERERKVREYFKAEADWNAQAAAEANSRFRNDLNEARHRAQERVKSATDVDLSALRGRGAEFVLEFTTVVVIIFAALILGVLRILSTEQIGTLLAAIAGYVLGRATSRNRGAGANASEPQPGAQTGKDKGAADKPAVP
jgi:hypothetical protein